MMKAIIYKGDTGAGHTLAAQSLKKALTDDNNDIVILDAFEEGGKFLNKTIIKGYQGLVELVPKIYRTFYNYFDSQSLPTELVLSQSAKKLKKEILRDLETHQPELIISTHPILTNIIGRLKDKGEFDIPIVAFITDFVAHDIYIRNSIDAYVVSNEWTKQTMIDRGADPEKIYAYGIPVREEFRTVNTYKRENDQISIIVMAGSLGSKKLKKMLKAILNSKANLKVTVVCGKNKRIRKKINKLVKKRNEEGRVEVLGFVNNISELMDKSDAIVTKPGGLTSSEAISKNIPIIIPYTYPGQEEANAKYLVDNGMAIYVKKMKKLTKIIDQLAMNYSIIEKMRKNMQNNSLNYSIDKTIKLCEKLANHNLPN